MRCMLTSSSGAEESAFPGHSLASLAAFLRSFVFRGLPGLRIVVDGSGAVDSALAATPATAAAAAVAVVAREGLCTGGTEAAGGGGGGGGADATASDGKGASASCIPSATQARAILRAS